MMQLEIRAHLAAHYSSLLSDAPCVKIEIYVYYLLAYFIFSLSKLQDLHFPYQYSAKHTSSVFNSSEQ